VSTIRLERQASGERTRSFSSPGYVVLWVICRDVSDESCYLSVTSLLTRLQKAKRRESEKSFMLVRKSSFSGSNAHHRRSIERKGSQNDDSSRRKEGRAYQDVGESRRN
jgi:hypothetical protein